MTVIKQWNPVTGTWVAVAQGTRGPQGVPGLSGGLYINVIEHGAKGDGVTDDQAAIQSALDTASLTGGTVGFPAGKVYMTTGGHVYALANTTDSNPLTIEAYGATIKLMSGSNATLMMIHRDNMAATIPAPFVKGGRWVDASGGTGNTCFKFRDIGARMEDVLIRGFAGGKAILLQNWYGWSEQSRILNCNSSSNRHAIYFSDGVDSGGPSGTTSFARTQVHNMSLSGGEAGYGLIRASGNVYHSSFIGLWGNLTGGEHIFQDDSTTGAFNGSRIHLSGFEGATAGSYFYYRTDGAWPSVLPDIYGFDQIGANMALTNLTDPSGNLVTNLVGKLRVAGYASTLGTEWAVGVPGNKSIVSARHPSGPNPGGTRVEWAAMNTNDELVIGSTNASRAPVATSLGRVAPVKICAAAETLGFFDATPVLRQTGVTARAALEAFGLGSALAEVGASYTEYPPTVRVPGTIWFMPSLRHQAIWTGISWEAMSPTDREQNACCVLGNFDLLIDAGTWSGTGVITNLGVTAGLTATPTSITQGTDGSGRKFFLHDGAVGQIDLTSNALYNIGATDSFSLFVVKSQAAFAASTAMFANRTALTSGTNIGWSLSTDATTSGIHSLRIADGALTVSVQSAPVPANQVKLCLGMRDVATDQIIIVIGSNAPVSATDTTTASLVNANVPRIGRLSGSGIARMAMNHYVSGFRKRQLQPAEITTLQSWAATRFP